MSLVDFAGYAGLILAIAAALDVIVSEDAKKRLTTRLLLSAELDKNGFQGADISTKFFGKRLLSRQAVSRYVVLSAASLILTYGFAYFTTPEANGVDSVSIFQSRVTYFDIFILTISVISAIFSDIVSYAQTRIFLNAVDRYKSPVVSLGLVVADGLISIGLFLVCFSFARFLISFIIILSAPNKEIVTTSYFRPDVIETFLDAPTTQRMDGRYTNFQSALSFYAKNPSNLIAKSALKRLDPLYTDDGKYKNLFKYSSNVKCVDKDDIPILLSASTDTSALLGKIIIEQFNDPMAAQGAEIISQKKMRQIPSGASPKCVAKVVSFDRSISQKDLLYIAGISNAYLAAFERTAYDTYTVAAFKFSPYVSYDPYSSIGHYLDSISMLTRQSFLGMSSVNQEKVSIFESLYAQASDEKPKLLIPFSPMLASCLSVTVIFSVYLVLVILSSLRNKVANKAKLILPNLNLNKTFFTSFGLVICLVTGLAFATFWSVSFIWLALTA